MSKSIKRAMDNLVAESLTSSGAVAKQRRKEKTDKLHAEIAMGSADRALLNGYNQSKVAALQDLTDLGYTKTDVDYITCGAQYDEAISILMLRIRKKAGLPMP
jgi:F0F1-type ATP synthase gamma subunit